MQTITTASDILTWITNCNPCNVLNDPHLIGEVAENIRLAKGRPAWGEDWEDWLTENAERLVDRAANRGAGRAFAALATDGRDPVVWGVGWTAAEAIEEAREQEDAPGEFRAVEIDAARRQRILDGDIQADDLWAKAQ